MERRRFLSLAALAPLALFTAPRDARASTETYRTEGTVKWIADDRTSVRIRHEDIPGFMKAMTMAFDARPALLEGLAKGDRVAFTFVARDDGRMVVTTLQRLSRK